MRSYHQPNVNPFNNAVLLGIAHRLNLEPHMVACNVRNRPGGGILLDVLIDGRDATGPEEQIIMEYLEETFFGNKPAVEG